MWSSFESLWEYIHYQIFMPYVLCRNQMFYKGFNCFRKGFPHRRVLDVFQRRFPGILGRFFKERDLRAASIFTNHSKDFLTHFMPLICFDTPWKHFFLAFYEGFRVYQKRSVPWNGLMTVIKSFGLFQKEAIFSFFTRPR